jgi:hypothetical protein
MVAIIVSLVWRRVPSVAEGQQVVTREGLLGMAPLQVSPQALTPRLDVLPAAVMGPLLAEVCPRVQAQSPPPLPPPGWAPVRERLPWLAMGAGSTLDALRQKPAVVRERPGLVWAGKMRGMVAACTHRPRWPLDTEDARANDQRLAAAILAALPVGGLWVCALGWFCWLGFADLTDQPTGCVTRRREKTASRTVQELRCGLSERDQLIPGGQDRAHPCQHPRRMVSVRWQGTWSRYLTHVLAPQGWSARPVCAR